jgi:acetyl-CoA carboxylase biotin carboxyl carrier protein
MLPTATDGVDPSLIRGEEDILSYVLLPEPALAYFKWKALPEDQRPEIPADTEMKKAKGDSAGGGAVGDAKKVGEPVSIGGEAKALAAPMPKAPSPIQIDGVAAELINKIEGLTVDEIVFRKGDYTISVRPTGTPSAVKPSSSSGGTRVDVAASAVTTIPSASTTPAPVPEPPKEEKTYGRTINAPLVGTFYLAPGPGKPRFVKEGDIVEKDGKVCIVEAMKLFNEISAPVRCKIVKILVVDGTSVDKDQPLFGIEEL